MPRKPGPTDAKQPTAGPSPTLAVTMEAPRVPAAPLVPALTPAGHLHLVLGEGGAGEAAPETSARLAAAFARGAGHGLLHLGAVEVETALVPASAFFRDFARLYVTRLCAAPDLEEKRAGASVACPLAEMDALVAAAPPFRGGEYLTRDVLAALWLELEAAFRVEIAHAAGTVQAWLHARNPVWNLVGRIHFHLAENRGDDEHPFAFLVSFTTRVSSAARVQHLPLGQALKLYAGDAAGLLALLRPVERAAEQSALVRELVESGDVYSPLAWTPAEAHRFLRDVPAFEAAGVVVRVPDWWKARPSRIAVGITIGGAAPSRLGLDALLDFSVALALDGETISDEEWREILAGTDGLALIRGRWVELDRGKLEAVLAHWKAAQRRAATEGMSLRDAMRLLAGGPLAGEQAADAAADIEPWSRVSAGDWLARMLDGMRRPEALAEALPGAGLKATLRPYQETGVRWLRLLCGLGLGACLADDMGLGKTVQVLGLLVARRRAASKANANAGANGEPPPAADETGCDLLVVPASLIANWQSEIERFAPSLRVYVAHPSAAPSKELASAEGPPLGQVDLVITTYGSVHRHEWIAAREWGLVILDEAQAIKNAGARQTRGVKLLRSRARIALTGTPVENQLGDLHSLFDFLNPGLLGSAKAFSGFVKQLSSSGRGYEPLRRLVSPYILRRLKTDKRIIADLPDKTEVNAWCALSRKQAVLYQQAADELAARLRTVDKMQRRGAILAFMIRFKQLCNHPSQWLGDGAYEPGDSGKFARLTELVEEIAARQEKVLVFTQFREITGPLSRHLEGVFGREGLVLHGDTPVRQRRELVARFQSDDGDAPFFVLSLKAGGTGLNLTAASHVIHFDRWWNPAVENQATDRAFRIGQKKNVMVHKFICRGTVEEKIDALIESKRLLSDALLDRDDGGEGEVPLTEMSNEEILGLIRLDLDRALAGE